MNEIEDELNVDGEQEQHLGGTSWSTYSHVAALLTIVLDSTHN